MYDEPGHVDALGKHRTDPKGILRLRRLISSSTKNQAERGEVRTHSTTSAQRSAPRPGAYFAAQAGTQYGQPRNLRNWPIDSLANPEGDLKRRCDQLQVLSRGLTFGGSWQNHLDEVAPIHPLVCVQQRGLIRLNILQRVSQRVLVLSGRMHCNGAKTCNSQSNQHCCDQAYSDFGLELFHKSARIQGM